MLGAVTDHQHIYKTTQGSERHPVRLHYKLEINQRQSIPRYSCYMTGVHI